MDGSACVGDKNAALFVCILSAVKSRRSTFYIALDPSQEYK